MDWMILPLKRYVDFSGRSRRMEYWMFALFTITVYILCFALMFAGGFDLAAIENETIPEGPGPLFYLGAGLVSIFALGIIIPSIALNVRRLHDRDMSGWWYLGFIVLANVPFVGLLVVIGYLVLMFLPGTPGPNRFGEDPKDPTQASVFE
ncbi:DUF805 domain-containing protein [Allopontixanthobacter sediminis]|uniref:DUF805 domain-containing protein n=1 Tax=Allopontixanthobacter sediminis TaxID=1689985 RepID=A0A845AYX4_9SPHN|nr:DUF805 domain-containing protein [Allopontixanthobacter sediminis]MXP43128.1 DUF805 domain-containing protein [Allopontixanthobacter sediminis]